MRDDFADSTFGSHHMQLVNHVAALFNALQKKQPSRIMSGLHPMNGLLLIDSGEAFGLVSSPHTASYGGLLEIKDETPEMDLFLQELDAHAAEMDWQPALQLNSTQGLGTPEPSSLAGDSLAGGRKGKRKALEILGIDESIETSPDPPNESKSATVPPVDKRRRLDQPHMPTDSESTGSIVSWLHNGDDLPVRTGIHIQV